MGDTLKNEESQELPFPSAAFCAYSPQLVCTFLLSIQFQIAQRGERSDVSSGVLDPEVGMWHLAQPHFLPRQCHESSQQHTGVLVQLKNLSKAAFVTV